MKYYTFYPSPLGQLLITAQDDFITGIWYPDTHPVPAGAMLSDILPVFRQIQMWLDAYFAGNPCEMHHLPLKPTGTPFQMLVWKLLLDIPWGQTTTYGNLAKQAAELLGREKMSAQAVGQAVGKNPISIVIPCHRCMGTGNTLTGYAGGLDRKRFLLDLEKIQYK